MKTGIVNLPLHYGKAPSWLFGRMKLLSREIILVIVKEYGLREVLRRLSDPFWFQAFGCVLGFDWHSSGLTTTVCGALKEALKDISEEIGLFVCGGKGATSRKTPQEIYALGEKRLIDVDPGHLIYSSKMAAKVDSCAVQDGYQLYHHTFILTRDGAWAVVQQGMNTKTKWARRYHWLGEELKDFVEEPHKAICCDHKEMFVLNMVAKASSSCREMSAYLARDNPNKVLSEFEKVKTLNLTSHHAVSLDDIKKENLKKILVKTYERMPTCFEELLCIEGVGPKTIRALALVSELIYGKEPSFEDPVRYSFAHGGKDGHPYKVERRVYDNTIIFLKEALAQAKIGRMEKLRAFKRLNNWIGVIDRT